MGSKIKEVRKALGLTQIAIKDSLGIPTRTQQGWENGERNPAEWLEAMIIREYQQIAKEKENSQG